MTSYRCVTDDLAQEDFFIRVEGVNDDVHETRHFGLELKLLGRWSRSIASFLGDGKVVIGHAHEGNENESAKQRLVELHRDRACWLLLL